MAKKRVLSEQNLPEDGGPSQDHQATPAASSGISPIAGARGMMPIAGCGAESRPDSAESLFPVPTDPPTPENLAERARLHGPLCLDALAHEARTGSGASRVSAANSLLERGFGKAGSKAEDAGAPALPPLPGPLRLLLDDLYGPEDAAPAHGQRLRTVRGKGGARAKN